MKTIAATFFCFATAASLGLAEPSPAPSPNPFRDIAASEIKNITLQVETDGQQVGFWAAGIHYIFGTCSREPESLSLQTTLLAQLRAAKSISVKGTPVRHSDEPEPIFFISSVQFHY